MSIDLPTQADVVIVGAGPAGLSAATWLKQRGVDSVLVLDRETHAGGIPRHCGHYPYGLREFRRLMKGPDYAARLVKEALAAGAQIAAGVNVIALHPGPKLTVTSTGGVTEIAADRVLLATGVRETPRAARLIGGTKPGGVMSTGALQGLVYLDGMRPFQRPVVLGTELVAFSAIMTCRHLGIRPAAMIEPGPRTTARWPTGIYPRLLGVPVHYDTQIVAVEGETKVTGVVLRGKNGRESRLATDGVIVSGKFLPEATLLSGSHLVLDIGTGGPQVDEYGRCSDSSFFAAGNLLCPVETAGFSWAEGRAVAAAILQSLRGGLAESDAVTVRTDSDALKYVMPQRVSGGTDPALASLQLRVTRAVKGQIILTQNGTEIVSRRISTLPERRISMPLPKGVSGEVTVSVKEDRN